MCFPKPAPYGTPSGSGLQSQIAVVRQSHEASLHKRSASPMWRLSSAIHGSAQFWKVHPDPLYPTSVLFALALKSYFWIKGKLN